MIVSSPKIIWYCHHYAGSPSSGMSYRPYYLSKEFLNAGHKVYIIRASFHHLLQTQNMQNKAIQLQEIDGVQYIDLKVPTYKENNIKRVLNMLIYAWRFKFHWKELIKITGIPHSIIVSSAHPFHYLTLEKLSRQFNAKIIFEVRDLWPLSLQKFLKHFYHFHPLVLWLSYIEKTAYKKSDWVVSLLKDAFPYMNKRGLTAERFRIISNGANISEFQNHMPLSDELSHTIKKLKEENIFLLGYAGAMGVPNALEYLLQAMAQLAKEKSPIHCILVGEGNLKTQLKALSLQLELPNVSFFDAMPKYEIHSFLAQMDALYLGWNDIDIYQYGVSPNKLFDYLASGRPIIESGAQAQSFIRKTGCGLYCKAGDPSSIAEAIKAISLMPANERAKLGEIAKDQASTYDYKILAEKYLELL